MELISAARSSIDVAMFIWRDDYAGLKMAGLLRDAAARGVRVRVVCDALARAVPQKIMDVLEQEPTFHIHNYHPIALNRPLWLNRRLHLKIMIVVGRHLVLGGRNFTDRYFDDAED